MLSNSSRSADSEVIPFFHDLPKPAISSAARLWDEAQSTSYNGQTAYQDFAQDLCFLHIEPPPRSIVKRWIAGVQANLIPRPGDAKLRPEAPLGAVAAVSPEKRREPVNDRLHRRAIEQEKLAAALPEFQPSPVKAKAELAVRDVDAMVAAHETGEAVRPSIAAEVDPDTRHISLQAIPPFNPTAKVTEKDFQQFAEQLVEATFAEIQHDARQRATRLAANRLREMADQLDARAAG